MTDDRIGLPFYWAWLTDHNFVVTFLLCLVITPGLMIVIAKVLESRWLPLGPKKQFLSFFPGDILLGLTTAGLLVLAQRLPVEDRWYNAFWLHFLVQVAAIAIAFYLTFDELKNFAYPLEAILSPTKIYHNFLLYAGYGYLVFMTLVAVLAGSDWSWGFAGLLGLTLLPALVWLVLVRMDSTLPPHRHSIKAQSAHVHDWRPIWRKKPAWPLKTTPPRS
ncbi:MAG TPA: hypothetical protein VFZ62_01705 [Candidatus Saccharimonadales bacterium]